jgi:DMSO reductase family type II enzyme heme b subunit
MWLEAERTNFGLVPQIIAKGRLFTPTNESISVRALYNAEEIAFLLEWDDRTKSIPGNKNAQALVHGELYEDAVAIQFPVTIHEGAQKPYFGHGDRTNPVNIWLWKSGTAELESQSFRIIDAKGFKKNSDRESLGVLIGDGEYDDGTWKVITKRSLTTIDDKDIQFQTGKFIPIAFANWDGSNGEVGPRHTHSTWYWVLLEESSGINVFFIPLLCGLLIVGLEVYFVKRFSKEFKG